jgi:hypothetical protein
LKTSVYYLVNVAMLIVKKRSYALQKYLSVNAEKAQTRLLFVVQSHMRFFRLMPQDAVC